MQKNDTLFDDMAKVFNNAFGTMAGMKTDFEALIRHQFSFLLNEMDLVTREEFDAVKEMASNARAEQEKLEKRLAALEKSLVNSTTKKTSSTNK